MLYILAWSAGRIMSPTLRNQLVGFEEWAWRNGLLGTIRKLEARALVERDRDSRSLRGFVKMTDAGLKVALGGRDPVESWDATWDGKWRLFLFDLPGHEAATRKKFHRALRACGCGWLQQSVWISPTLPDAMRVFLDEQQDRPGALILLEALSRGPELDRMMVSEAWDFEKIAQAYAKLEAVLSGLPRNPEMPQLLKWAAAERAATRGVLAVDPLLPRELYPRDYPGFKVWKLRASTLEQAFESFETFAKNHD